ncbi:MAG: hypothetical protein QOF79_577 [Actinomycetota bacterium]|nr:hypothetical protein [Actinomycetota bacterium]
MAQSLSSLASSGVPLSSVADDLYALTPGEFTAARNARAADARKAGDAELSAQVRALSKPSASAWAINLLARESPSQLHKVCALGESLRQAQTELDRDELTRLSRERRQLVHVVSTEVAELASQRGLRLSSSSLEEIEGTLQAATADPGAADAVRSGRLVRALTSTGVDPVDLTDAVAATGEAPATSTRRASTAQPSKAAGARRAELERSAKKAEKDVRSLDSHLADILAGRESATTTRQRISSQLAELDRVLADADEEARKLRRERAALVRTAERARAAADRSKRAGG